MWERIARELDWQRPWDKVLTKGDHPHVAKWFPGGAINLSQLALDRHVAGHRRNKVALIWEGEAVRRGRLARRGPEAHLLRPLEGGQQVRVPPEEQLRDEEGRQDGGLPPDGPRGGDRPPCRGEARRDLHGRVQRVQRGGPLLEDQRPRRETACHGGRPQQEGKAGEPQGDSRQGARADDGRSTKSSW